MSSKQNFRFLITVFLLLNLPVQQIEAQIPFQPLSFTNKDLAEFRDNIAPYCLSYIDSDIEQDKVKETTLIALESRLNIDLLKEASRFELPDGTVYILTLESTDARGLELSCEISIYDESSFIYMYDKHRSQVKGYLTNKNNTSKNHTNKYKLNGDSITIEYFECKNLAESNKIIVRKLLHVL